MIVDKKEIFKRVVASIFFIGGLLLVLVVVLIIGKDKGFTKPKFQVTVLYADVQGLIEGAPVRLSGVNVGHVDDISFLDKGIAHRRVQVILDIFEKFHHQLEGQNLLFSIKTEGVLGQKLVEIYTRDEGPVVNLDEPILGADTVNVEDLAEVFASAAQSFTMTSERLSELDLKTLSLTFEEAGASLSDTAKNVSQVLDEVEYLTIKSKRLINRVEQRLIDGNLFKVF